MANEENEVLTRFTAVDEQLQDVSERVNKTIGQVAEKSNQAHFSMRHAMALVGSQLGLNTSELMHYYYALTMLPPGIGEVAVALMILKKLYDEDAAATKKATEAHEAYYQAIVREAIIKSDSPEVKEAREKELIIGKEMNRLIAERKELLRPPAGMSAPTEEDKKALLTEGGKQHLSEIDAALKRASMNQAFYASKLGAGAQKQTEDLSAQRELHDYELKSTEYTKFRMENVARYDDLLQNQIDTLKKYYDTMSDGDADKLKTEREIFEATKKKKDFDESVDKYRYETDKKITASVIEKEKAIKGEGYGQYLALKAKTDQGVAEAERAGDYTLAAARRQAGDAEAGKMGHDAQMKLQGQQHIGFSGLADFWKSFNSNQMTPAEREQRAQMNLLITATHDQTKAFVAVLKKALGMQ